MDCDNVYSDNPKDWKTYKDVQKVFLSIPFYVIYSRIRLKRINLLDLDFMLSF